VNGVDTAAERSPEPERQALHPAMHQKILLRVAEVVAMGWTRGTAARDTDGQKLRSTLPQATAWWVFAEKVSPACSAKHGRVVGVIESNSRPPRLATGSYT
jgi:hypothetical protein